MATQKEKQHYDEIAQLCCVACRVVGILDSPAEIHHTRAGAGMGQKSRHVIPLCDKHHRNGGYGVAFHAGKIAFESVYGTEEELLRIVRDLLGE